MFRLTFEHPQRQYDVVVTKKFVYKLIYFSEPLSLINGNYNIKMNSNNNLKCIKR